jgi:hypothetical protein
MGAVLEAVVKVILEQYFNKCDRRSKDDVEAMEWLTDILEEVDQEGSEPDGWCNVEREIRESTQKIAWALVDLMDIPMVPSLFSDLRFGALTSFLSRLIFTFAARVSRTFYDYTSLCYWTFPALSRISQHIEFSFQHYNDGCVTNHCFLERLQFRRKEPTPPQY